MVHTFLWTSRAILTCQSPITSKPICRCDHLSCQYHRVNGKQIHTACRLHYQAIGSFPSRGLISTRTGDVLDIPLALQTRGESPIAQLFQLFYVRAGTAPADSNGSSTLLAGRTGLEQAKQAIIAYKTGQVKEMTPEIWKAKKIVDSTIHPGSFT